MSSGGKATFVGIDGPGFTVQYNPREFSTNKTLSWSEAETSGGDPAKLQYQKGEPMTASMELIFDTTSSGGNVQSSYVKPLLELTKPTIKAKSGQAKDLGTKRPPAFMFTWGAFSMPCVIESVDVTYLMFSSSGDPVRAKCSVKLKEWTGDESSSSVAGAASAIAGAASSVSSLVEVKGGQTLSQVAAAYNTTAQAIASVNKITDPMADLTGTKIAIPSSATKAVSNAAKTVSNTANQVSNAANQVSNAANQGSNAANQVSNAASSVKRAIPRF